MLKKFLKENYNRFGGHIQLNNPSGQFVTTTDGVGTKALLAHDYTTIGHDVVNHCVNDILCEYGIPVAFTNYIGLPKENEFTYRTLIQGITQACQRNDVELIGGETAIMGDVYKDRAVSVVGTMIGKRYQHHQFPKSGDLIIGLPSSGLHTNGYTVARNELEHKMKCRYNDEMTIQERLLVPHRSYLDEMLIMNDVGVMVTAICHITGGGWQNLYRVLSCDVDFELKISYHIPKIFKLIGAHYEDRFMFNEFNMGVGMVVVIDKRSLNALDRSEIDYYQLGIVEPGEGEVRINGRALLRESY